MPYVRKARAFRKKGVRKGRKVPWYRKKYSAMDAGRLALSQIWKLKGLVNSEMHKNDIAFSPQALSSGSTFLASAVALGDADNQRTGNSIYVRAWNFNGSIIHNAAGANTQFVRLSVVMDTQQIGDTTPGYTDVYESNSPYAHLNSNSVGRFKVLYSRLFMVNNNDKTATPVKINLPMRHHVRYNGSTTSDIQKGGLYFCYSCDEPGANMPTWQGEYRLSYHDN